MVIDEIDLFAPVEKAVKILSKTDVEITDVFASCSRVIRVNLLGKSIKDATSRVDVGIGIRAYKNRGLGAAFSQSLDPADVETTANKAVSLARVAKPDIHFKGIPGPYRAPPVSNLRDEEIVNLSLEEISKLARLMIEACREIREGATYLGGIVASHMRSYLTTSTGISVEDDKTSVSAYISPTYRDGDGVGSSFEYDYAVSLAEIDFHRIGATAAMKALEQFGSKRVDSGIMPLIIAPDSTRSFCLSLLAAISGEDAVKGRSFASSCVGTKIAPEVLNIYDDGTIPGAIGSSTYDGEGVPRRPTKVIENGTLLTFLHNSYSAGIAGVETTGHAQRFGYTGYIGAGPSNVRLSAGDSSSDEMIKETRKGILVISAGFMPNMISGDLSSTIDEGFFIESGQKKHPVKNLMIGGHILDIYKNIELISKEGRTIGKGFFFPYIKVREVKIAGK